MIKDRKELEKALTIIFEKNISNKNIQNNWAFTARMDSSVPLDVSIDYITLRKDLSDVSVILLYALASAVQVNLSSYFTHAEINSYSAQRWIETSVKFPLVFDMTKINDEQFIGKISVKTLMQFKDAQLINYNENAQRTMRHVVKGETEYYQISLNKEAVNAIVNSYTSDIYIPNTITLNLPEDSVYVYDEKKKQLVIKETSGLDILDGYHRYIAMSKVCRTNPDFDYDMELRIVQFSEDKAKRFIWQEDQKTKMRKIDSDALDTSKASNKVVERLNNNPSCLLSGQISRNNGIINAAELSNIIDMVFFKGIKKSEEIRVIKKVTWDFLMAFETLDDMDPKINQTKWDKKFTFLIAYLIKYDDVKNYKKYYEKLKKDENIYKGTKLAQSDITWTHKLFGKDRK